ncbi:endonuclease [Pseudoalteromonas sp. MM1]|uniref:TnsA endonuclease N-terminal domain-containing protein n=1 Tax=Pseudoalteromonas sp. MM1 TaxID=3036714 RepID=UPI0025726EDB|nr:TnsA endonuclease N-terminal domain-containing protein [Pseudoalteromonas sp. MM1]BED87910.1 endonuclease [Pseudoalteromonas sp. MM1]
MYIRNLRKPSPNKNVFKFASTKVSSVVMCESTLEFDACFHHEYNDLIESFGSQPEGFKYEFMGKSLPYTPDALIAYTNKTQKYHEYKPYSKIASPLFRAEFAAKRAASLKLGIDLVLVTDRQIRVNPILNNLKLLHRYSGVFGISSIQKELLNFIHKSGAIKLNDISRQIGLPIGEARSYLFALMGKGLIKANLGIDDLTNNPTLWVTP